jgi:hypothetical protein
MSVAHTDMNFPPIPGLAPHPKQLEAQAQSLEQKRESAGAEAGGGAPGAVKKSQSLMPEQTRNTLKALNASMRKAANLPDPAPAASPASAPAAAPAAPAATPAPTEAPRAPAAEPKGRRADAGNGDAATKRIP